MGESTQITFKFSEIAEELVRKQGIRHGHWGLFVKFAIAATNAPGPTGDLLPTAIVPILEMGIQKFDESNSLTIDASKLNPRKKEMPKGNPRKGTRV
jgi:hypothetical protein